MKSPLFIVVKGCISFALALAAGSVVFGDPPALRGYMTVLHVKVHNSVNSIQAPSPVMPLPRWTYNVTASPALGGNPYTGTIIGRSPYDHGKTTTTIPVQIVPLIITINDGTSTVTYDPTVPDVCVPGNLTDVSVVTGSPLFTNNTWTMNGIDVGSTQYIDAFQRAQFWSLVGGTPYHLMFAPSTLGARTLTFAGTGVSGSSGPGRNYAIGCGNVGVVQINDVDTVIQSLIFGPLSSSVNAGTFPIFLMKNVVMTESGTNIQSNCCILGYHSAFQINGNVQVYSPFALDTVGAFGSGYVAALSHEIGETINNPATTNPAPTWGNMGQVQNSGYDFFEVGDPLSNSFNGVTPHDFTIVGANSLPYRLQEMAFYSWFYGGTSLGAGGKYSNNGALNGEAKHYPPGGTN